MHAVAALLPSWPTWSMFTSQYYHANTYKKAYAEKIVPLPQQSLWDQPPYEVGPPARHRKPGRPKGVKRKEADEAPRPAKKQRICRRYKLPADHNARGCQGGPVGGNKKKSRASRLPKELRPVKIPRSSNTVYKRPEVSRGRKKAPQQSGDSTPQGVPVAEFIQHNLANVPRRANDIIGCLPPRGSNSWRVNSSSSNVQQ